MKKFTVLLAAVIACMTAFSGCNLIEKAEIASQSSVSEEKNDNKESDSESETEADESSDEVSENADDEQVKDEESEDSETETESESEAVTEEDEIATEETEAAESEQSEETPVEDSVSEDAIDILEIGQKQFEKSCETQWKYLFSCPYELDYNDTYEYAVRVIGVNSISDILAEYNEVFAGNRTELSEKYVETQDALYCYDGGRGENISYLNTELELISNENDVAVFNAISHYADPETGEPMEDEVDTFTMINYNGIWKTSEFTLPC